jgi:hypothetical protein
MRIAILKKDHDTVKTLFDDFEKAEKTAAKEKIIDRAVSALKIHAVIEEESFYPTVRAQVGSKVMNEFTVLAESVRHHITEEENEMLPKAKELKIDFEAVGQRMLDRKKPLQREGIPSDAEHSMVAKSNSGDSPAKAAREHKPSKARKTPVKVSAPARRSRTAGSEARKSGAKIPKKKKKS